MSKASRAAVMRPEAVLEIIGMAESGGTGDQPAVVNLYTIVEGLLGFDPSRGKNTDTRYQGGRSRDAWINEHLSMGELRKLLARLVEEETLVKLTVPLRFSREPADHRLLAAVHFPYDTRTGYLRAETYREALARADASRRAAKRTKLLQQAKDKLAENHAAELDEIYRKLCSDAGLDPDEKS